MLKEGIVSFTQLNTPKPINLIEIQKRNQSIKEKYQRELPAITDRGF